MLRRKGLTAGELAAAYESETRQPYTDGEAQRLVKLFGKPPYEFLGQTPGRDYPRYEDFAPQFVDDVGRQYQRTDEADRFYVRIPIPLTRSRRNDALYGRYEDQVDFPRPGEQIVLRPIVGGAAARRRRGGGASAEAPAAVAPPVLSARVRSCPFDARRAVSNIFFDFSPLGA